jgi:hypothetical protein
MGTLGKAILRMVAAIIVVAPVGLLLGLYGGKRPTNFGNGTLVVTLRPRSDYSSCGTSWLSVESVPIFLVVTSWTQESATPKG